jgi:polyhydroxyalkanoate synthesis regulator phasin
MAFESVRSYVQLASGLGELTKARALEAAQGLLALPGADEVTRRAVQASTVADQLLEAARANRASLLTLVRTEIESALQRADLVKAADLEAARTTLSALAGEVADLRSALAATGAAAVATAARTPLGRSVPRSAAVSTVVQAPAPVATPDPASPTESAAKKAAVNRARVDRATAKNTVTKKAVTKKTAGTATGMSGTATKSAAAAKKSTARKTTATESAAVAKKSTARKTTGRKTAPVAKKSTAKKSTPRKATATKTTAAGTTAAKKTTAKKTTAKKATAQ